MKSPSKALPHQAQFERNADRALDRALTLLHPKTRQELERNRDAARDWLVAYQRSVLDTRGKVANHLAVHRKESLEFGEGFERVTFGPRNRSRYPLRPGTQFQDVDDAAFDILATGMLSGNVQVREVEWKGLYDDAEIFQAIGDSILLVRAVRIETQEALIKGRR